MTDSTDSAVALLSQEPLVRDECLAGEGTPPSPARPARARSFSPPTTPLDLRAHGSPQPEPRLLPSDPYTSPRGGDPAFPARILCRTAPATHFLLEGGSREQGCAHGDPRPWRQLSTFNAARTDAARAVRTARPEPSPWRRSRSRRRSERPARPARRLTALPCVAGAGCRRAAPGSARRAG